MAGHNKHSGGLGHPYKVLERIGWICIHTLASHWVYAWVNKMSTIHCCLNTTHYTYIQLVKKAKHSLQSNNVHHHYNFVPENFGPEEQNFHRKF